MGLSSYRLNAMVAVTDMTRASEFYEGKLGLSAVRTDADGSKVYTSADHESLVVYPSPDHAGSSTATLVTWYVDDVEQTVDELELEGRDLRAVRRGARQRLRLRDGREGHLTPSRRRQGGLVQGSRREPLLDRG